ncbi:NMUR2-like protein, partial [Mya arenaria]
KLVPFLENTVANVSILTIVAISIERYKVIRHPLQSINEHTAKVWVRNTITWVVSLVFCIPWIYVVDFREYSTREGRQIQVCRSPINENWKRVYILLMSSCFFILPAVALLVINWHMFCLLRRNCHQFVTSGNKREYERRQKQVANNVASIVVIFFLCHLPFRVSGLWFTFAPIPEIRRLGLENILLLIYLSRVLFYLNHAINPLVYNFVSSKFRESFKEVWVNVKCCRLFRRRHYFYTSRSYWYTGRTATTGNQMQSQL